MEVSFDKYSLLVDGKRQFIRSGAFHYFRNPGVNIAHDRFLKLKAAGYNAVDIYFYWNYHSKKDGEYDFTGIKDVRKVLQTAKDVGLFVIARPGPFINAEVNAGGFPFWVLKNKDVIPRNRIVADYHYSPVYMKLVNQWYDQIIPIINDFDNVIAFQIENEYSTNSMEEDYMQELYKMARDRGIKCPIFHNDAFCAGLWADVVDIYACDTYPYINPNQNWKQDHFCFDTLDNLEDMARCSKPEAPIFIAEMQAGWFDKWDGKGYKHIREALGDEHINIVTKTAISQGLTMFNHYMAIGGTSWDDIACDEVYTSYEFTAPIDEYGILQPNYFKAKEINYFLNSFGLTQTEPEDLDFCEENIYAKLRKDLENNCSWLFIRNLNSEAKDFEILENKIHLEPYMMKICPVNLDLFACKIEFSDAEIFARIKNDKKEYVFVITDKNSYIKLEGEDKIIADKPDYERISFQKDGKITEFVFLSKKLADKTWIIDDKVIFNADMVLSNGGICLSENSEISYLDLNSGFSKKYFKVENLNQKVELSEIEVKFSAPEIDVDYDYSDWKKCDTNLDSLSNEIYDEFIWYRGKLPQNIKDIVLSARHLFGIYINGKEVLNRNSYKLEKLQQIPETIEIPLNNEILNKKENDITILVENLGFDKGFSNDTNIPRGLVTFKTEPEFNPNFYIKGGLSLNEKESESPYLAKVSTKFNLSKKINVMSPYYLDMEEFKYNRATIFLNGVKIGRYLRSTESKTPLQTKFYLIDTFLKFDEENLLEIVIWDKDKNIKTSWDFKSHLKCVKMEIGTAGRFEIF